MPSMCCKTGGSVQRGTVSVVQSVSVAVNSSPWYANRLKTISRITVQIAQHGPILVIESASVTGSAECLPALQKMVGDVSRAKQALPSEFTSATAQALRVTWSISGKCWRTAKCGPDLMETQKHYGSAIELFTECDALAVISEDIVEKLETTDFQCRLHALQQTMNVLGTSFQGAGAAEKIAALKTASDSVSAAGAKVTKDGKDEIEKGLGHPLEVLYPCIEETARYECVGQFFSLWSAALEVLPDDAAQASYELARCTTTLLIRVRQLGEGGVTAEYGASDDAHALASLCERVKVKVDVTEKFSYGTPPCVRKHWRAC